MIAYAPFYAHYQSQFGEQSGLLLDRYLGWVRAASPLMPWLTVWGIPLFLSLSALAGLWLRDATRSHARASRHRGETAALEASAPNSSERSGLARSETGQSRSDIHIDDVGGAASDGTPEGVVTLSSEEIRGRVHAG